MTLPVTAILDDISFLDYPGRPSMVLFTGGCNLRCGYCHNASLLGNIPDTFLPEDYIRGECGRFGGSWTDAAVITGGEPTLHGDSLLDLIDFLKDYGFSVKLDTNGTLPAVVRKAVPLVDYTAMDIKCPFEDYPEFTGCTDRNAVRESFRYLVREGYPHEFRTTILDFYHTDERLERLGEDIRGADRLFLQAFRPGTRLLDKSLRKAPPTSSERMLAAKGILEKYVGKVIIRGG